MALQFPSWHAGGLPEEAMASVSFLPLDDPSGRRRRDRPRLALRSLRSGLPRDSKAICITDRVALASSDCPGGRLCRPVGAPKRVDRYEVAHVSQDRRHGVGMNGPLNPDACSREHGHVHLRASQATCRYAPRPGDLNADRGLCPGPGTPVTPA